MKKQSFTKEQINNAEMREVRHWSHSGGWEPVSNNPVFAIRYYETWEFLRGALGKCGIYEVQVNIDGEWHTFYSDGAKAYGLENLD